MTVGRAQHGGARDAWQQAAVSGRGEQHAVHHREHVGAVGLKQLAGLVGEQQVLVGSGPRPGGELGEQPAVAELVGADAAGNGHRAQRDRNGARRLRRRRLRYDLDRGLERAADRADGDPQQTINQQQHPLYYEAIQAFQKRTGVPVLVNTSFNTRGEPIVCSPRDAVECFWTSPLDALVIGSFLLDKLTKVKLCAKRAGKPVMFPSSSPPTSVLSCYSVASQL